MRWLALAVSLSSCAHRVCGRLSPDDVSEFHRAHYLSVDANESAVEGLAAEDGTGWLICVGAGVATIQNHRTAQEVDMDR
mgnify:CR=1 FL=1